jgi:hypothetical protein
MTMRTTNNLIIAAVAALSGAAMAQEADYQNLWNGGFAPEPSRSVNPANAGMSGRTGPLVTMFGSQNRTLLDAQPGYSGGDGGAAN